MRQHMRIQMTSRKKQTEKSNDVNWWQIVGQLLFRETINYLSGKNKKNEYSPKIWAIDKVYVEAECW